MRLVLFFCFYILKLEAQQQFRTSDFGYSDDVVTVEEALYKYDSNEKKFLLANLYTTEIENSYFKKQNITAAFGDKKTVGEYLYYYLPNNQLSKINYNPVEGNFGYPINFLFQYEKAKLVKMVVEGMSTTFFEYDRNDYLVKEIVKDIKNNPVEVVVYTDYKNTKEFTKIKKSYDGMGQDLTKETYKNGLLMESEFVSDDFKTTTKYSYDNYKNIISQVYNDSSRIDYGYAFDLKKNRIKVAKLSPALPEDNSFTFIKITYSDGTTSGSTTLDLEFVKKHDRLFREKDSLIQTYQKIAYSRNNYLSILKRDDAKFEIQDSYDNDFEKVTQTADTPEHSSLIIFSETDASVHFVKNYYLEDFPKNEWMDAIKLESPTKIFWVKDNKYKISFYQEGKYLESSNFSVENDENPNHLTVNSKDGKVFQIQNIDASEAGMLYPLKLK